MRQRALLPGWEMLYARCERRDAQTEEVVLGRNLAGNVFVVAQIVRLCPIKHDAKSENHDKLSI